MANVNVKGCSLVPLPPLNTNALIVITVVLFNAYNINIYAFLAEINRGDETFSNSPFLLRFLSEMLRLMPSLLRILDLVKVGKSSSKTWQN